MSASLESIPIGYGTSSLGPPPVGDVTIPSLPDKIQALADAGFTWIELAMSDLEMFAESGSKDQEQEGQQDDYDKLADAAAQIRAICDDHHLDILVLQPFAHFEGWPHGSEHHRDAWKRVKGWVKIMQRAKISILQVGSSDIDRARLTSQQDIIADLRELGHFLADQEPPLRVAYEPWCWSTHAPTWSDCHAIVRAVNLPNVGLCMDTFQIAGGELADPSTSSGFIESPASSQAELEQRFAESLARLSKEVKAEEIFYFQISDAYKPESPLKRADWSQKLRPMPFNGGYLPVTQVFASIVQPPLSYRGPCSVEIFDAQVSRGAGSGAEQLKTEASQSMESWQNLLKQATRN